MKTLFPLVSTLTFLLFTVVSFAQTDAPLTCGSDQVHEELMSSDPYFARAVENLNQRALQNKDQVAERSDEIYTIPVVVHVVHEGEPYATGSNISDEQVQSAIVALNEDFRKMEGTNGDGEGVDCNIEFCLASRDPEGNSTNGIVRVDGSVVTDYAEEGIESSGNAGANEEAVKALSTWPNTDYMNVWVVNEIGNNNAQSGVQGYAYFPTSNPVDGIVLLHNAFGTVGNLKSNTDLNRTLTHEAGHYLALYHTFHMTSDCEDELNCSTQGDKVCDTPPTPLNAACSQPACDGTQQVANYLDYTPGSCKNMFSEGQKLRMRNTLETERASILESMGCVPATDVDAGITDIASPSGSVCDNIATPELTITNFGSQPLVSVNINYRVDAGPIQTFAWSGDLAPGNSQTIELPQVTAGTGSHTFISYTTSPNGTADENPANDQLTKSFEVSSGAALNLAINLDYFGTETTWQIKQEGEVLASGGPYVDYEQGLIINESVCLNEGCYVLRMQDAYGDGQAFQEGNFELTDEEATQLAYGANDWGSESLHDFCVESTESNEAPVANFSMSDNEICVGESLNFNDLSTNNPTSWSWTFEGAGISSSQSPQNVLFEEPGTFSVTLTASNEFGSDVHTATVTVSGGPQISLSPSDITCFGEDDGTVEAEVSGGILPYVYAWSNNSSEENLSNLATGNYTLSVTDAAGCENNATANISSPSALNVSIFKSDISCHGMTDGSATVTATGGEEPYSFTWSNGGEGNSQQALSEGTISVTVTDANGCTVISSVEVVEPSALSLSTSATAPETCAGNDGSGLVNVMGGTPNYTYNWSNGGDEQSISELGSGNYTVTVTDANGCTGTSELEILYDCDQDISSTQLSDGTCGMSEMTLDDEIECDPVDGAEMYLWKLSNLATGFYAEEFTVGSNPTFQLSNLMDMTYGQIYEVNMRVMIDGSWSAFGPTCTIQLAGQVPFTAINSNDCELESITDEDIIHCDPVTGASGYTWKFENGEDEYTAETVQNSVAVSSVGLTLGVEYDVAVKATVGSSEGEYGTTCSLVINNSVGVEEIEGGNLVVYPNPSTGTKLNLDFSNLFSDKPVIEFGMYDMNGKMIEAFEMNASEQTAQKIHTFNHQLAPGMYFLRYELNGRTFEEKLIVQ